MADASIDILDGVFVFQPPSSGDCSHVRWFCRRGCCVVKSIAIAVSSWTDLEEGVIERGIERERNGDLIKHRVEQ